MHQGFITITRIFERSDDEPLMIPIITLHPDANAARANAITVIAYILEKSGGSHLLEKPVSVLAYPLDDEGLQELIQSIRTYRPELLA